MHQKEKQHAMWLFLRPEIEELIVYVLTIVAMLGYAAYQVAVRGSIGADTQDLTTSFTGVRESFLSFLSQNDALGTYFLFGLWVGIGAVVYMLSWALITVLVDMSRDIRVSSSFIHPRSFHQSNYWLFVIGRNVVRIVAGITLIFYGVVWGTSFAPVWIQSFETLFAQGWTIHHSIDALIAIIGVGLTLHIGAILLRVTLLRARY